MENPVTRQEFETMMQMIRSTQDMLERLTSTPHLLSKEVWDSYDVMTYLRISESTLRRGRKAKSEEKKIPWFRACGGYRYDRDKILKLKDQYLQ